MADDFERDPLTAALRDSLARHAAEAPQADLVADRVLAATARPADGDRHGHRRGWRTWALPLVAAGAVAGVVAAVVGIENAGTPSASHQPGSPLPSVLPTALPTTTTPTVARTSSATTASATTAPTTTGPSALTNVRITDLTFVADDDGWALGSADCVRGPGRCTAMWRTTDGRNWTSMPGAAFNVPGVTGGCTEKCVQNIRFANDEVGYAFGPSAFFTTDDGGRSWQKRPGGAIALETLDQNVIRVTSSHTGCPALCDVAVQTAGVGSDTWTATDFSASSIGVGSALLSRGGHDAYLLLTRNPAGGAADETSTLYRSTDDGQHWVAGGEPCPQAGGETDSVAVAAGAGDGVSVLCARRLAPSRYRVASSTDAGGHFAAPPAQIPLDAAALLAGDPESVLVVGGNGLARSTDGGHSWQAITDVTGEIGWVGFESQTVGRAVSADGSRIWTTRDGGATWQPASIG